MFPQRLAGRINEQAGISRRGRLLLEEGAVIPLAHKADLLTLFQLISRETQSLRTFPDFRLLQIADRKEQLRQG